MDNFLSTFPLQESQRFLSHFFLPFRQMFLVDWKLQIAQSQQFSVQLKKQILWTFFSQMQKFYIIIYMEFSHTFRLNSLFRQCQKCLVYIKNLDQTFFQPGKILQHSRSNKAPINLKYSLNFITLINISCILHNFTLDALLYHFTQCTITT